MRGLGLIYPVLFAFGIPLLFADQVAFRNGDRLSGAILKSNAQTLVIKTVVAGEVTVSWQEVQELRSDLPLHVELANGKTLVGKMTTREGRMAIVTSAGTTVDAPKESVVSVRNDAAQEAYERTKHANIARGWDGGLDAGLELTRGNSDTRNFRLAFRAARKVGRDRLNLFAESFHAFDDVAGARPHNTADQNRGGALFERHLTSRSFVFVNADFMNDELQDLNLRSVLGGGAGYHLIQGERATLDLLGGANFTRENYVGIQRNLMAAQAGEEFTLKLGKNTSLIEGLAYFPDVTDPGDNYRTGFNLATVTRMAKWLGWQNNIINTYVTNPPQGKKKSEFVFTSGLRLAFSN